MCPCRGTQGCSYWQLICRKKPCADSDFKERDCIPLAAVITTRSSPVRLLPGQHSTPVRSPIPGKMQLPDTYMEGTKRAPGGARVRPARHLGYRLSGGTQFMRARGLLSLTLDIWLPPTSPRPKLAHRDLPFPLPL